ncbi:MAG: 4-alpha-glucanotransferase [Candidatus Korobacteraceae bacterium]
MENRNSQPERLSGVLVHPSSFPSRGGIGDFGPAAYEFLDWMVSACQGLWQILPLGPLGYGNSPYSSISAFAGNPLLISLERLAERGWIAPGRLETLPINTGPVDFERVYASKLPLLQEAAGNFLAGASGTALSRYEDFKRDNYWWLEEYVLFLALRRHYPDGAWNCWPREFARRDPNALNGFRQEHHQQLEITRAIQFAFWEQWRALHHSCRRRGIRVMGDVAIFVSYDSADVWNHPGVFYLDDNLDPIAVAGVPPDFFSKTGQRWGNPLYRWDVLKQRGYDWWVHRMRWALETCDLVRIDHFRGFAQYWEIPVAEETAVNGKWVDGPGAELFHVIRNALGRLPVIAEDLGYITPDVHALRKQFGIPGMCVMQFGFGYQPHKYLPHWYDQMTAAYTGTHDNDTTLGWWQTAATEKEKLEAQSYLGFDPRDPASIPWAFVRALVASPARYSVVPLQDVLALGSEARMNTPSVANGNWTWRYNAEDLTSESATKLAELCQVCDRFPATMEDFPEAEFFA